MKKVLPSFDFFNRLAQHRCFHVHHLTLYAVKKEVTDLKKMVTISLRIEDSAQIHFKSLDWNNQDETNNCLAIPSRLLETKNTGKMTFQRRNFVFHAEGR